MDLPEHIEAYCVCPPCAIKHVKPASDQRTCSVVLAQNKHLRDVGILLPKDSRVISIQFIDPIRPKDQGTTRSIHVTILAYFSRVVDRLVTGALISTSNNKRLISTITFEDETFKPSDVQYLVEWCYTGRLASLAKSYEHPALATEEEDEDEDDEDEDEKFGNAKDEPSEDDDDKARRREIRRGKKKATMEDSEEAHDCERPKSKKSEGKPKLPEEQKLNANVKNQINNYRARAIPKFAAESTLERLYCIAVDLEMPEFANYIMGLLMAKYSWNFFSTGPPPKHPDPIVVDAQEQARKRKRSAESNDIPQDGKDSSGTIKRQGGQRCKAANGKLNFRSPRSQVPFRLMFRDAPFSPQGLQFVFQEVTDSRSEARGRLMKYMTALIKQRNVYTTTPYTDEPLAYKHFWRSALESSQNFKEWYQKYFGAPTAFAHANDSQEHRVYRLLSCSQYLIDAESIRKHTKLADPESFWTSLMNNHIQDVLMEESVEPRRLRTREDNQHLTAWLATYRGSDSREHQDWANIAAVIAREVFSEKRDVSAFRFGDF